MGYAACLMNQRADRDDDDPDQLDRQGDIPRQLFE
jgi:hypothetical protein